MQTHNALGIIWYSPEGHSEVMGIECFAVLTNFASSSELELISGIWEAVESETQISQIEFGEDAEYVIAIISINVRRWPDDETWMSCLKRSLTGLVDLGALVAWAGGWDSSFSPVILKDCSGDVYAGFTKETGFLCNSNLSEEYDTLTDEQIRMLGSLIELIE